MELRRHLTLAIFMSILTIAGFIGSISVSNRIQFFAEGGTSATVTVFPAESRGSVNKENYSQSLNFYLSRFWNSDTGVIKPSSLAMLQQMKVGNLRYPGGLTSRLFHWAQTIGPMQIRSEVPAFVEANKKVVMGVDEVVREGKKINNNMSFTITLNDYALLAESLDLVEYMTGEATNCGNFDETEWLNGQETAALGYQPGQMDAGYYACLRAHPDYGNSIEPYNVSHWEIGNEDYAGHTSVGVTTSARTAQEYKAVVEEFAPAIKAKVAESKVGAVLHPSPNGTWNQLMMELYPSTVDFFSYHYYSRGGIQSVPILSNYIINAVPFDMAESANVTFKITARGERGSGESCPWPNMRFSVNGTSAQNISVESTTAQEYTVNQSLTAGSHIIQAGLTNDCSAGGGDTNLYIDKIERETASGFVAVDLISPDDFVKTQVENAYRIISQVETLASALGNVDPPILVSEYNSHLGVHGSFTGGEVELNRSMTSTFFMATLFAQTFNKDFIGSQPWLLQERAGNSRNDLLYYDGDPNGGTKNALGTPYGNSNYWFYQQVSETQPAVKIRTEVTEAELFQPPVYLHPSPLGEVPLVQSWATKRNDGSLRVHVVHAGEEELDLHLRVANYAVHNEIDVTQLRSNDGNLLAYNASSADRKTTPLSDRLAGDGDQHYQVAPQSITSFTFYPEREPIPPPPPPPTGGGTGGGQSGSGGGGIGVVPGGGTTSNNNSGGGQGGPDNPTTPAVPKAKTPTVATPPVQISLDKSPNFILGGLPEDSPKVIAVERDLLANPYFLPFVTGVVGVITISIWIALLYRRYLIHRQEQGFVEQSW